MTKVYRGSCHCGAVKFAFRSDEISVGKRCNCSICVRRGTLMSERYKPDAVVELSGLDALSVYQWGDRLVNHWFCRTCGIHPFSDATTMVGHYRFNLGCVEGIDVQTLPFEWLDGKSF